ncbi:MAG: heme biosynthesis HemY N-terminal domain-containing protein, partial [Spirochaetaceae bacterium]|nr:heme biosynthesis HemY N-terminal domain-containing protein [Spirochaetaceae bacterium]
MGTFIQSLVFVLIGVLLLWFGYSLFFTMGKGNSHYARNRKRKRGALREGIPGAPRTCPVC